MHRIQIRIAEDTFCLEDSTDLFIDEELVTVPEGFIGERKILNSSLEMKKVNLDDVDRLKRGDSTGGTLMYYYRWDDKLGFLTSSGSAPSGTTELTMYYWRIPDETEKPSLSQDPALSSRWDECLYYGTVAEMTGDPKWWTLFDREYERQVKHENATRVESGQVAYNSDYD